MNLRIHLARLVSVGVVWVVLSGAAWSQAPHLLLLWQGPDGHPPGTHEYRQGITLLHDWLQDDANVRVTVQEAGQGWPDSPDALDSVDGVVMFLSEGARWLQDEPRRLETFQRFAARGGGLAAIHWAMGAREARYIPAYVALLGGCHGGPDRQHSVLDADVGVFEHPITRGIQPFSIREEFYYRLKRTTEPGWRPLLAISVANQTETVAWAWERPDGGRSFGFTGGHFQEHWQRPDYRKLITQAATWIVRQ